MSEEKEPGAAAALLAALTAANVLLGFIERRIAAGKERAEWTPEEEAAFDAELAKSPTVSHWKRTD